MIDLFINDQNYNYIILNYQIFAQHSNNLSNIFTKIKLQDKRLIGTNKIAVFYYLPKKQSTIFDEILFSFYGILQNMGSAFLSQPITEKRINRYQHSKLRAISCEMQGWRKNMEDAILYDRISKQIFVFGVFDGHGGVEVSQFCASNFSRQLQANKNFKKEKYELALQETFRKLDQLIGTEQGEKEMKQIAKSKEVPAFEDGKIADNVGCTANVLLIVQKTIYVANAGDSRAALSRNGKYMPLSIDHKPDNHDEVMRIIDAGGKVQKGRINGHLNLSRSIGDHFYKKNQSLAYDKQIISCKPQVKVVTLTKQDDFLIMGCDGVWQKYETDGQGFIDFIRQERLKGVEPQKVLEKHFDTTLAKSTSEQNGCDNMSAVLIEFNKLML